MRPFWRRLAGREVLLFLVVISGGGIAGGSATVEAREYSAYSDPDKPVISVILSEESNVQEFQTEFGLSDDQIQKVLAIVREENEVLAREYAESEQIVASNENLSTEQVESKIAASNYDERVRAAIAETKADIEALLPEDRRTDLAAWVDAKFAQEDREASGDDALTTDEVTTSAGRRAVRCSVFATQYHGYTSREVALPHRTLKDRGGFSVRIRRGKYRTTARVKEVGPWNLRDNYWQSRKYRDMWDNLARCRPEAEAAYYDNYNKGEDQFGREVRNPAGVDLTPRVARTLGLKTYQNAWVNVTYPWTRR
jgi:hypothetical protein